MKMKTKNMLARESASPNCGGRLCAKSDYRVFNGLGLLYCGLTHPNWTQSGANHPVGSAPGCVIWPGNAAGVRGNADPRMVVDRFADWSRKVAHSGSAWLAPDLTAM